MSKWAAIAEAAKQKTRPVQKGLKGAESPITGPPDPFLTLSALSAQGSLSENGGGEANGELGSAPKESAHENPPVLPKVCAPQTPQDWRAWLAGRIERRIALGYSKEKAARLAWGEAECEWHMQQSRPDKNFCAGCGRPCSGNILTLPDGALVHDADCLTRYGSAWRQAAADALHEKSVRPLFPTGTR